MLVAAVEVPVPLVGLHVVSTVDLDADLAPVGTDEQGVEVPPPSSSVDAHDLTLRLGELVAPAQLAEVDLGQRLGAAAMSSNVARRSGACRIAARALQDVAQ